MTPEEAANRIRSAIDVTRGDIARAKHWLVEIRGGAMHELPNQWLAGQGFTPPKEVDTDSAQCAERLVEFTRACSLRLAFYQAVAELVAAGELIPAGPPATWQASLGYHTSRGAGGIRLDQISCSFPAKIERPPLAPELAGDPDLFLAGIELATLHPGIREAIEQALGCFRRGLYMPATVMLAAAAEAAWTECAAAVAKQLTGSKLDTIANDQYASISKLVAEVHKALQHPDGKALLKLAGEPIAKIRDAEVWTTALRDRRNALHWSKANSFVAEHSDTATLLIAAPLHLRTLERVRLAC
jgi:hypothetical protein